MSRKGMDLKQLNDVMKRCSDKMSVRYVTPTIHPHFKQVVSFDIHTSYKTIKLTITNNPDENFDLCKAVNDELDKLQ